MSAARHRRSERLGAAQGNAHTSRHQRHRNVAGYAYADGGERGGVGVTSGHHLDRPALGKIRRRRIHSIDRNPSDLRRTARNSFDAPTHSSICGIAYGRSKPQCFTKQHCSCLGRDFDLNGGRWWRRLRYRACASPTAAQSPRTGREENKKQCPS